MRECIILLMMVFAVALHAQNGAEGSAEFECLRAWSNASEFWKNQDYARALPLFRSVMVCDQALRPAKEQRLFKSVYEKLADCYMHLKFPDSAVAALHAGYEDFNDPYYLYKIGEIYHKNLLQFDSAAVYYRKNYDLTGAAEELRRLGSMWIEAANYKNALIVYEEYLEKNPKDEEIWKYTLESMKKFYIKFYGKEKWVDACKKYSELFPNASNDFFVIEKMEMHLKRGEYDDLIRWAKEVLNRDSTNSKVWTLLSKAYDAKERHPDAISALERANRLDKKNPDILCDLARLYLEDGQYTKTWPLALEAKGLKKFGMPYYLIGESIRLGIGHCAGDKLTVSAKEAFLVAAKYYDQAAAFPDVEKSARMLAASCRENGPTKEDCFLHALGKLKSDACYSWMLEKEYIAPCK